MLFISKNIFFSSAKFIAPYSINYLVIAGGGSGGLGAYNYYWSAGPGGAGGYLSGSHTVTFSLPYTVTIGGGGVPLGGEDPPGGDGTSSSLISSTLDISTIGGGGARRNGGSGGGSHYVYSAGLGTPGQGFDGANGPAGTGNIVRAGGGGGAGQAGTTGVTTAKGGDGLTWLDGITRAGGGGGYRRNADGETPLSGPGGAGGGGRGANSETSPPYFAENGVINTGSGGGAAYNAIGYTTPGNGGSGVVIIRYLGTPKATGGTITQSGGYTYHTFNSSGIFST
jgi:hypothetical protein